MPAKNTSPKTPEQSFESALERLERIVDEIEGDRLPLEQLLERYGEGTELLKACQEKLEVAEKKIEMITRDAAGKPSLVPFVPNAIEPPAAAASRPPSEGIGDVSLF